MSSLLPEHVLGRGGYGIVRGPSLHDIFSFIQQKKGIPRRQLIVRKQYFHEPIYDEKMFRRVFREVARVDKQHPSSASTPRKRFNPSLFSKMMEGHKIVAFT